MARESLLDHLEKREDGRLVDNFDWLANSFWKRDAYPDTRAVDYATKYVLELRSRVAYIVPNAAYDTGTVAHEHAKRQMTEHIYGAQIEIAHKMYSALFGGASRKEIEGLVNELLESMRYDGHR